MPTYREQVLADGAVAYWRLDEASGNALSLVGNYPGTVTGGVTRAQPGALADGNTAMAFDGVDDKISVANGAYSAWGTGPATVECWFKVATGQTYPSLQHLIDTKNQYNNNAGILIILDSFGIRIRVANGTASTIASGAFVPDGQWHHLTVLVTRGATDVLELYVDGIQRATQNFAATGWNITSIYPLTIATDSSDTSGTATHFAGVVDEVAIYHTALTPQQIANHYALKYGQRTYQEFVIADGAVAYWKLDESSGTVARSQVGSYDGTISGGVTLGQPGAIQGYTAMTFDGTSGKIVTAVVPALLTPFTIELWIRRNSNLTNQVLFCNTWGAGDNLVIWARSGDISLYTGAVGSNAVLPYDTQWHHFVCVLVGGAAVKFYIDGQTIVPSDLTPITFAAGVAKAIELGFDPNWTYFNGSLDEVAIYNTALTPQQIAAHYTARQAWPDTPYAPSVPVDVYPAGSLSNRWLPLTPSDVIDAPFGKLWIGGAGNLAAVGADGRVVTFAGVKAGTMLPLAGRRINATNTTATAILALRTT